MEGSNAGGLCCCLCPLKDKDELPADGCGMRWPPEPSSIGRTQGSWQLRFLLLAFLLLPLPVMSAPKYVIQHRVQFGNDRNYQTQYGMTSAYRTSRIKVWQTGKVYRIVDGDRHLVDLFYLWTLGFKTVQSSSRGSPALKQNLLVLSSQAKEQQQLS